MREATVILREATVVLGEAKALRTTTIDSLLPQRMTKGIIDYDTKKSSIQPPFFCRNCATTCARVIAVDCRIARR
jgi:hypothetical protein